MRAGTVGTPLPGVEVRIMKNDSTADEHNDSKVLVYGTSKTSQIISPSKDTVSGELHVKGDNVFKKYWNRPEVTQKSFTNDGWFKTGEITYGIPKDKLSKK